MPRLEKALYRMPWGDELKLALIRTDKRLVNCSTNSPSTCALAVVAIANVGKIIHRLAVTGYVTASVLPQVHVPGCGYR